MSKHNLSEKSDFTNLSEFLVHKKIIYFVALKYDHTVHKQNLNIMVEGGTKAFLLRERWVGGGPSRTILVRNRWMGGGPSRTTLLC
jgi:hypothetical protein